MSYIQTIPESSLSNSYNTFLAQTTKEVQTIITEKIPLIELCYHKPDFTEQVKAASKFSKIVVLGTGGSSLNGQALVELSEQADRITFVENVDSNTIERLLNRIDLQDTFFLCISKSGTTLETLAQLLVIIKQYGVNAKHFMMITDNPDTPIGKIATQLGAPILPHAAIGGRFSTFTNVGLLPAALVGLSTDRFIDGALNAINQPEVITAGAAFVLDMLQNNYELNVTLSYIDRLAPCVRWYRQIWAESLGKNNFASTPIDAYGTIDQHSQLQLYLAGKKNKFFNVITLEQQGEGLELGESDILYLNGKTLGDIMQAEQEATIRSLTAASCPLRHFSFAKLDEYSLGQLMMQLMLETILIARILQINPFDQPAVEHGKQLAREMLVG